MKRNKMDALIRWKNTSEHKPLLLLGARQVGKTYLLREFAREQYETYIYINFEESQIWRDIFEEDLNPLRIINEIELNMGRKIDPEQTLIFMDEIQQAPRAITSLKYFNEQASEYSIVCAGSLLGVMLQRENVSFPVGKVVFEYLYPFTFDEFLVGLGQEILKDRIQECFMNHMKMPETVHDKLMTLYKHFLCIGGMPEAVNGYIQAQQKLAGFDRSIHSNIINAYIADMGKYSKGSETVKVQAIYRSMPEQLARENRKFKYSTVTKGSKAAHFESAIEWLLSSRINMMCKCVNHADFPLSAYTEGSIFKMYMSDTGLLATLGRIPFSVLTGNEHHLFKGAVTENYIAAELFANGHELFYYRRNAHEVDFIIQIGDHIIPVEVKASANTRSRSLIAYIDRYDPVYSVRFSAKNFRVSDKIHSIPLYAAFCLKMTDVQTGVDYNDEQ